MKKRTLRNSSDINESLKNVLPGALQYNFHFPWEEDPIHFVDGKGHFLIGTDGYTYLDFFSKFGAAILGHKHSAYTKLLSRVFLGKISTVDNVGVAETEIMKKFISFIPGAEQVRFSLSGTEAIQNALRLARAFTKRDKIIRFVGHYHGNADNVLGGISSEQTRYAPREMEDDGRGTKGRARHAFSDSLLLPWNNIKIFKRALSLYRNKIAAVIFEPICINGGGIVASREYLEELKKICIRNNILIIFDEVITGFRLSPGSAQSIIGIKPDIWIFGKAIGGGGVPVSCIVSRKEIMNLYASRKVTHGGTFNGYPLGLYAMDIVLDILGNDRGLYKRTIMKAKELRRLILLAAQTRGIPLVIQGHPMAMCIHASSSALLCSDEWSAEMKKKEEIIRKAFLSEKILLAPPCRMYPNITLDDSVLSFVKKRIDRIFESVWIEYRKAGY